MEKGETNTRQKTDNPADRSSSLKGVEGAGRWRWGFEQRIRISNPLFRFPRRVIIMLNEEQQQAWWLMLMAVRSFHSRVFPLLLWIYIYIYVYISLFPLSSCFSRGVDRGRELDPIAQRSGFLERQWRCCWSVCKRREKRNALMLLVLPHCF